MKRIAIFSDGTWRSPEEESVTNVLMMARAVSATVAGVEQVGGDWSKIEIVAT